MNQAGDQSESDTSGRRGGPRCVAKIEPQRDEQQKMRREGDVANTLLSGPDGLLAISDTQILIVENGLFGAGNNRLVQLNLDPLQ